MGALTTTQSAALDDTSDQSLIAAYLGGDERAAAKLIGRHLEALGRFLYSSGAPSDEVEDMAQEAFFRAFRRVDSWRGQGTFRSWLLTIAGNLLRDHFRTRKGRRVISIEEHEVADRADPQADLAATEIEERLRLGLEGLPRLQREVFLLRAQQGSDYEEIAIALGTTPGAARVHYHHAVRRLKELINE
jgi:RNA polymerase sigma-70 factor (ECF subfamily)